MLTDHQIGPACFINMRLAPGRDLRRRKAFKIGFPGGVPDFSCEPMADRRRVIMTFFAHLQDLFRPETIPGGMADRPTLWRPGRLSFKALFWCLAAILISLGLGRLT